jgi:hypothetical protein
MNIDYRVRNSIYCTLASRALSAAQLLNGPSHARLTVFHLSACCTLQRVSTYLTMEAAGVLRRQQVVV